MAASTWPCATRRPARGNSAVEQGRAVRGGLTHSVSGYLTLNLRGDAAAAIPKGVASGDLDLVDTGLQFLEHQLVCRVPDRPGLLVHRHAVPRDGSATVRRRRPGGHSHGAANHHREARDLPRCRGRDHGRRSCTDRGVAGGVGRRIGERVGGAVGEPGDGSLRFQLSVKGPVPPAVPNPSTANRYRVPAFAAKEMAACNPLLSSLPAIWVRAPGLPRELDRADHHPPRGPLRRAGVARRSQRHRRPARRGSRCRPDRNAGRLVDARRAAARRGARVASAQSPITGSQPNS